MTQTEARYFGAWDYVVFGVMLGLSAAIGIYSAVSGGRQRTADEFFLGNRKMSVFPVAMSVVISFISAISVIGTPGEIYMMDTMFAWSIVSYILANILICRLFLPILFKLRITSVYQYLEMRFNRSVRTCCTVIFSIQTILYMGIAMYTPALAINAVTGMDLWACVVSTGAVCIFYTTIGGMKAVLWTDTLQTLIIVIGVAAVIIKGTMEVGGVAEVWRIGLEGKRIEFVEFSFDPTIRYSFWTLIVGMTCLNLGLGANQTIIQRLFSCGSKKRAIYAMILATFTKQLVVIMCISSGVVMYAYYSTCDPYSQGVVKSKDQLMPLFVMDLFGNMPGLPGLFLSAVVSASISTLSSGVNSLAALSGEDGVRVLWPNISPLKYGRIIKLLALMYGILSIGFAFVASVMGQGVLALVLSIIGISAGAVLGTFILGIYVHRSNSKGAMAGLFTSVLFVCWMRIGAMFYPSSRGKNPLSVVGCDAYNSTIDGVSPVEMSWTETYTMTMLPTDVTVTQSGGGSSGSALEGFYHVSFMYYGPIGAIICVTVGTLVSWMTGFTDPDTIDDRLLFNLTDGLFCCFPESLKRWMRCGASKSVDDDWDDGEDFKAEGFRPSMTDMRDGTNEEEKQKLPLDESVI